MKTHSSTLTTLDLGRNHLTTDYIKELCAAYKELSNLETIEMTFPKEISEFDHIEVFKAIAGMAQHKPKPIRVVVSDHYTRGLSKSIQAYLEQELPNIQIVHSIKTE